jgi:hypothetical protein
LGKFLGKIAGYKKKPHAIVGTGNFPEEVFVVQKMRNIWILWAVLAVAMFAVMSGGCGGECGSVSVGDGKSLSVAPASLSLKVGKTGTLTASNYTGALEWSSWNESVATVSALGAEATVNAVAPGAAEITVIDGSGAEAACMVTVTDTTIIDDMRESREIISKAAEDVRNMLGDDITAEKFALEYIPALEKYPQVTSAACERKESMYDSYIDIEFYTGFACRVAFSSRQYSDFFYYGSQNASLGANYPFKSEGMFSKAPSIEEVKAFVGASGYDIFGDAWLGFNNGAAEYIYNLMLESGAACTGRIDQDMTLQDLRSLQGYDYIFITAHGGVDYFAVSVGEDDFVSDASTQEDILHRRVLPVVYAGFEDAAFDADDGQWDSKMKWEAFAVDFAENPYYSAACVLPEFFRHHYGDAKMNNSIVFLEIRSVLGGTEMPGALLDAGAKCVIGYDKSVSAYYAHSTSTAVSQRMSRGDSLYSAIQEAENQHGDNDYSGKGAKLTVITASGTSTKNIFLVGGGASNAEGDWIEYADISWYDPDKSEFEIDTPFELAGVAKLANETASGEPRADFSGKTIRLTEDIYLSGLQWTPIGDGSSYSFEGTFDGGGNAIAGLAISGQKSADALYSGLFGRVGKSGVVKDVNLADVNIDISSSPTFNAISSYAGGVAGQNSGAITGCSVSGYVSSSSSAKLPRDGYPVSTTANSYVGGIAGQNDGTITGCGESGRVSGKASSTSVYGATGYSYIGGIAGRNSGEITGCGASGDVSSSTSASTPGSGSNARLYSSSLAGGIAGQNSGSVTGCDTSGRVSSNYYSSPSIFVMSSGANAGGIVGSNSGTITECIARGSADASSSYPAHSDAGGIAGSNSGTITGCDASGDVSSFAAPSSKFDSFSRSGGVAGSNSCTITGCIMRGDVSSSSTNAYAGGIAGSNSGTVTGCTALGDVSSSPSSVLYSDVSRAGGIVGYNSGTITGCDASGSVTASGSHGVYTGGVIGYHYHRNSYLVIANNVFLYGFGPEWGIGYDGRQGGRPSNDGCEPF